MKLSIVVPLYNEEHRFKEFFPTLYDYVKDTFNDFEFVCVNDGSRDKTKHVVRKFKKKNKNLRLINVLQNKGKGHALKVGVLKSKGDFIFFTDVDLSADIEALPELIKYLEKKADIVITSRRLKSSNLVKRQHSIRETMGKFYTRITNGLLGLSYVDMTCGLKGGHKKHMHTLFSKMHIKRWSFDPEMLFIAKKHNMRVAEHPISWVNNDQSKVNILVDAIRSFRELLEIRLHDLRGHYG